MRDDMDRPELVVARRLTAVERVRRDVAALGADPASAPDVPADVTDRIGSALRALPPPSADVVTPRRRRR